MRGWQSARSKARAPDAAWSDATIPAPSWPPKAPDEAAIAAAFKAPLVAGPPVEVAAEPAAETPMVATLEIQPQVLRLLDVVTTMCDHVIDYIEADRAERRLMIETLTQLGRVVTDRAAAAVAAEAPNPQLDAPVESPAEPTEPFEARERVIGGSMPAGSEPVIDLRQPEPESAPEPQPQSADTRVTATEIAVEVRGRFGDRWVGGFEICEVMTTPDGPRYRLRRHRDGVVLPELFDATSIRHIETFDQLNDDQLNDSTGYWSRS
jgi:hypothetical protein